MFNSFDIIIFFCIDYYVRILQIFPHYAFVHENVYEKVLQIIHILNPADFPCALRGFKSFAKGYRSLII